jgi:hypothetical protein
MFCQITRLAVLIAAFAIGAVVVPSAFAQDREPERSTSETAHCKEIRERQRQEARRLRAQQRNELARCGPAASAKCADIRERHKREVQEMKARIGEELKDCKQERKEDKKDRKEDKKDNDKQL